MSRECNECSMCCKLSNIEKRADGGLNDFPFDKPAHQWCKHFSPGVGCTIHSQLNYPSLCRNFRCAWLDDLKMPDEWRPDKSGAMFAGIESLPEGEFQVVVCNLNLDVNKDILANISQWRDQGLAFAVLHHDIKIYCNDDVLREAIVRYYKKQAE